MTRNESGNGLPEIASSQAREVVVVRALQLGDMLCAVPALRAIRNGLPGARITLVGLAWAQEFARRFSAYVDDFLTFPGYPGILEVPFDARRSLDFFAEAQSRRFDLAIQLHGNGERSNQFLAVLGARRCAGFYQPGQLCPDASLFAPYRDQGHEIHRLLALPDRLGFDASDDSLEFPLLDEDIKQFDVLRCQLGLSPGAYACLHAGARDPARRWPPAAFALVARELASRGLRVLLTGEDADRAIAGEVARLAPCCEVVAGRTSLGSLACLLRGAALLVCNDTGVSHLAAALRTPSVVIYTSSDPERWAPLDSRRHRRVDLRGAARTDSIGLQAGNALDQAVDLLDPQPQHRDQPPLPQAAALNNAIRGGIS